MSDYRAVAGITAALQGLLHGPVSSAVPGASVRAGAPSRDPLAGAAGLVNLFLYQVTPNASWRNRELPVRRSDGRLIRRPQTALDLHYLLSFYGDESKLVPQLLLGAVVSALHAQPTLTPADIPTTLAGKEFRDSGLREEAELAQFVPIPMTHEEISKLWSIFFQIPFALSVAYRCQVVLIEADLTPEPALPALEMRLHESPWRHTRVDRVVPQAVEWAEGATVRLEGEDLGGDRVRVRFDDLEVAPRVLSERALEVGLPPELPAGVRSVRVVHRNGAADPGVELDRSNPASFVLVPKITGEVELADGSLRVPAGPSVGPGDRVELLLNEWTPPGGRTARSYRLRGRPVGGQEGTLEFPASEVASGDYLVRLEVNEVASRLLRESDPESPDYGRFDRPRVTVP